MGFGSPRLMLLASSELKDFLFQCLQLLNPKNKGTSFSLSKSNCLDPFHVSHFSWALL